jgi:hypothetical protein
MKVSELIALLQQRHPDAQVEIYANPHYGPMPNVEGYEYALFDIVSVGDWGAPGTAGDLVTINLGKLMGC